MTYYRKAISFIVILTAALQKISDLLHESNFRHRVILTAALEILVTLLWCQ